MKYERQEKKKMKKIHYPVFAFCQLYNSSLIVGPKTRKEAFKQTESTDLFSRIIGQDIKIWKSPNFHIILLVLINWQSLEIIYLKFNNINLPSHKTVQCQSNKISKVYLSGLYFFLSTCAVVSDFFKDTLHTILRYYRPLHCSSLGHTYNFMSFY